MHARSLLLHLLALAHIAFNADADSGEHEV